MEYDIGCDADGKVDFCKVEFVGDTGAHASVGMKVLERSAGHATGAYNFPVTDVKANGRLHQQPAVRRDARFRRQSPRLVWKV